jgi:hypothetical protein
MPAAKPAAAKTSPKASAAKETVPVKETVPTQETQQKPAAKKGAASKMSPKAAATKAATVEPTVEQTVEQINAAQEEKAYSEDELKLFREWLDEEACDRIASTDHLNFYMTRGSKCPCDVPEGFVYREGMAHRYTELQRLRGIVSSANKDPVDYKYHGEDRTISRKELRQMESAYKNELKHLPAMLEHGLEESVKRERREIKEARIEGKVQKGENLLVIRKEILDSMKGALGKAAVLGETETRKTRTGLHQVPHYKFTSQNLDVALAMFKQPLPTVRSNVINLLMRYMSEKKLPMTVGKKDEESKTFSMPPEFVTAFKKVVGSRKVEVNVERMIFSDVQKLLGLITEEFSGKLDDRQKEAILTDISLVDFAKAASKEARERELKAAAAARAK